MAAGLEQARAFLYSGRYSQAEEVYRTIVDAGEAPVEVYAEWCRALLRDKKPKAAAEALAQAEMAHPASPLLLAVRGAVEYRAANFVAAEQLFRRATAEAAKDAYGWLGLTAIHRLVSRARSARQFVQTAYRLAPQDPQVVELLASSEDNETAHVQLLEKALALYDPRTTEAQSLRAHLEADRALLGVRTRVLESPYVHTEVKLISMKDGPSKGQGWGLRVKLNGNRTATLQLDTGASGIYLGRSAYSRFGLKRLSFEKFESKGVGDDLKPTQTVALAESVDAGGVVFRNVPVRVSDQRQVVGMDGLIGTDLFREFLVTLDFPRQKLILDPFDRRLEDSEDVDRAVTEVNRHMTPVMRAGNHLFVRTAGNRKAEGWFLVDTGAALNFVAEDFARRISKLASSSMGVSGVSGNVKKTYSAASVDLAFAGLAQQNDVMVSFDFEKLSNDIGFEVAGILGRPALDLLRLALDYRNGLVDFRYERK